MTYVVTGASGYIGSHLVEHLLASGKKVISFSRRPSGGSEWQYYSLDDSNLKLPDDVQCVVHLAMNTELNSQELSEREVKAAKVLLKECQRLNAKFIFISSQTAQADAATWYGKTKYQIELLVNEFGGISIRPGLVYGGRPAGLYLTLLKWLRMHKVVPKFFPDPIVQPIHVSDLCIAIHHSSTSTYVNRVFKIAAVEPIGFFQFLNLIGYYRYSLNILGLPIPQLLIHILRKILPRNLSLTRLHSLFTLPQMDTQQDLNDLNLITRPLSQGIANRGDSGKRLLLLEGKILLEACLSVPSNRALLKKYFRYVTQIRGGEALQLSSNNIGFPLFIKSLDLFAKKTKNPLLQEFIIRLNAMTFILESSQQGAEIFLNASSDKPRALIELIWILVKESAIRVVSIVGEKALSKLVFVPRSQG